jgi:hypothetical protein
MKNDDYKCGDLCISDGLPCSCLVKGVDKGFCVKEFRGKIIVCPRFSDVSLLESSICEKVKERARKTWKMN